MARVFERLTAGGFKAVEPETLKAGDVFQVRDSGSLVGLAADALHGDPQLYVVSQVDAGGVVFPKVTASGTEEVVAGFAEP